MQDIVRVARIMFEWKSRKKVKENLSRQSGATNAKREGKTTWGGIVHLINILYISSHRSTTWKSYV